MTGRVPTTSLSLEKVLRPSSFLLFPTTYLLLEEDKET